jgi:membrane-associated protease RseP (regulator of RpoE activity)
MPYYSLIGTLGAVIRMSGTIRLRNALFDIGASGPLCGLAVALPVLVYGIAHSPIQAMDPRMDYVMLGEPLLYKGLLYALKGPIPVGHDLMLSAPAFAGWAGLLVTMINLVPVGQLDGGHVAYALFGERQDVYSRWVRRGLLAVSLGLSLAALLGALQAGVRGEALVRPATAGLNWLLWWGVLTLMARFTGDQHPPTEPSELSPARRVLAWFTLLLFVALFMPTWISWS